MANEWWRFPSTHYDYEAAGVGTRSRPIEHSREDFVLARSDFKCLPLERKSDD